MLANGTFQARRCCDSQQLVKANKLDVIFHILYEDLYIFLGWGKGLDYICTLSPILTTMALS